MTVDWVSAADSDGSIEREDWLPIEASVDLVDLFDYGPVLAFAPDGTRAAFSLVSGEGSREIRVVSIPAGKVQPFGRGNVDEAWAPAWSPDGRYLAFFGRRGPCSSLWLWDTTSATYRETTAHVPLAMPLLSPVWTRDSQNVLVPLAPGCKPSAASSGQEAPAEARIRVFSANRPQRAAQLPSARAPIVESLASIAVATGEVRPLFKGNVDYFQISPDGSKVAALARLPPRQNAREVVQRLHVIDLADGHEEVVPIDLSIAYSMVSWSADGNALAWVNDYAPNVGSAYVVELRGMKLRRLRGPKIESFAPADYEGRRPLWTARRSSLLLVSEGRVWRADAKTGAVTSVTAANDAHEIKELIRAADQNSVWSPDDGRSFFGITRNVATRNEGVARIWLDSGKASPVFTGAMRLDSLLQKPAVTPRGDRVVFVSQTAADPPALWMSGAQLRDARRLAGLNVDLGGYEFGRSLLVQWVSTRGEQLSGALLLPPNYKRGQRRPLVVDVYGGSRLSQSLNLFGTGSDMGMNFQVLATRGYAVFRPDAPVRVGSPLDDLAGAVLPGIDAVIALGFADPERIAVMGHSYGGYNVISLMTRSGRFRAAIAGATQADLLSAVYGNEGKSGASPMWVEGTSQGRMGGTPWEFPDRYIANSPIWRLDKVTTPLLLVHGSADPTVPVWGSTMVFNALARLGREVEYVQYEGEGHAVRSRANRIDLHRRMIDWLDEHLRGAAAP
jgi:dipeptidyl aminopeptidase/acylaminoacyl peptidase